MTTKTIDIAENPPLSELLRLTSQGTEVLIARSGQTLARLVPVEPPQKRVGNLNPGSISVSEDFDAPLPDEFWLGTE